MSSSPLGVHESGILFVVSAPSGTGKTTVMQRLVKKMPGITMSRSYTSRPPRNCEADGVDYNFVSRPAFEALIERGEFLEWAEVFGNFYGTGRTDTETRLRAGGDVALVIDVQGARQVRRSMTESVGVFVLPPSFDTLEQRLRGRCQDAEAAIQRRLTAARTEVTAMSEYDYVVVNDDLDRCVDQIRAIVLAERTRLRRQQPAVEPIVKTFTARG